MHTLQTLHPDSPATQPAASPLSPSQISLLARRLNEIATAYVRARTDAYAPLASRKRDSLEAELRAFVNVQVAQTLMRSVPEHATAVLAVNSFLDTSARRLDSAARAARTEMELDYTEAYEAAERERNPARYAAELFERLGVETDLQRALAEAMALSDLNGMIVRLLAAAPEDSEPEGLSQMQRLLFVLIPALAGLFGFIADLPAFLLVGGGIALLIEVVALLSGALKAGFVSVILYVAAVAVAGSFWPGILLGAAASLTVECVFGLLVLAWSAEADR